MYYVEMFSRPRREVGGYFGCQGATWDLMNELGQAHGWRPTGTAMPQEDAAAWHKKGGFQPTYAVEDIPLVKAVTQEDALAWAQALEAAANHLGPGVISLKGPGTRILSDRYPLETVGHLMFGVRAGFIRRFASFLKQGRFIFFWEDGCERIQRNEDQNEIMDMFDFAMGAWVTGNHKEAREMFLHLTKAIPDQLPVWLNLGIVCREMGDFSGAVDAHREATRIAPGAWDTWQALGNSCREAKLFREAADATQNAVRLAPNQASCWSALGSSLTELKDYAGALDAHQRAMALEPQDPRWPVNMAVAIRCSGDHTRAISFLRPWADRFPDLATLQENLGQYLQDAGQPEEAVPYLERAAELEPKNSNPRRLLVLCHLKLGDPASSKSAVLAHLALEPNFKPGWELLLQLGPSPEERNQAEKKLQEL